MVVELHNWHVHCYYLNLFISLEQERDRQIIGMTIDRELESDQFIFESSFEYRENLLEQLEGSMPRMQKEDPSDFFYVLCLVIKKGRRPDVPFSKRQFKRLCKIHTKYCNGR